MKENIIDVPVDELELSADDLAEQQAWSSPEAVFARETAEIEAMRQAAYQAESDPLFFKYQRDEDGVTKQAWLDKIEEIRQRYPLPEQP